MRGVLVILWSVILAAGSMLAEIGSAPRANAQSPAASTTPLIPPDQLDSLVAPIALYPDPLLAQTLAASTYPLEIIQLQQFLARNPGLKDKALVDAVQKEPWDPSIQSLAATPDVVKRLADDIQWTTDLGNAFLAQEADVMAAVQRMRMSAVDKNVLKTTEQQVVQTKVIETKTVVVIEPANPQVIYVPTYSPVVVWGPPIYPYPPIYYPPPPPAGSLFLAFGVGVAMGAWWGGGGGWGYNCGWGGNNVTINNNNTFIRNTNIRNGNTNIGNGNGNRWQHQPQHRGGAPYRDRATADRYGGAARGDSLANRQTNARNQIGKQGGNVGSARPSQGAGVGNRGGGNLGAGAGAGPGNRTGGGIGAGGGAGNRAGGGVGPGGGAGNRGQFDRGAGAANPAGAGGADRVGNRDLSRGGAGSGGNRNAFGSSGGYNGSSARASSNRGAASTQQSRGGGGGGARSGGGGARSGGGARR
ncbi:MAG: DUF3300 domain-containing protein [Steroidobacteraceae bacterium]